MIDLHAHVLPGVDDGPRTLEEAVSILRAMESDGVTAVAATPHVRDDYPTTVERMRSEVDVLCAAADDAGLSIRVLPGGEIDLARLGGLSTEERVGFGLGGNPHLLLLEFPYVGWPLSLREAVFRLRSAGVVPLIAHPERNRDVQVAPERLQDIVRGGAFVQVTATSVDGRLGRSSRRCALRLIELGLAHVLASDAHAQTVRSSGLAAVAAALGEIGTWMVSEVPRALLASEALPSRPEQRRSQHWWQR